MGKFNVRDFGAKGDAVHDDTDAIQNAVYAALGSRAGDVEENSVRGTRYALGAVELPAGIYKITRPIKVWAAMHLNFLGEGGCTRFYPVGKMDCVLDFNGICNCEIGRFIIEGHNNDEESIENAIQYRWDGQVGRSSASNHFHDISVLGTRCVTGFRIGEPNSGVQCDTTSYNNIVLQGNYPNDKKWWKYGFYVGTDWFGNCLEHWFRDINVTHWDEGYHVSVTNFALDNANFGGNGTDVVAHTLSYFRMQGIRSELSNRFLVSGTGASSSSANFSISDVLFWTDSLAKDGQIIQFKQNGTLYLRNFVISPERKPNILVQPYKYCSLIMDGVTCSSTREEFKKNTNDRVVISAKGFITEYQNGQGFLSGVDYHS